MHLDPRRLAFLLAVHRYGGVLAAADELGVTASAVSQQIARLEREVGVRLLDRQPSGAVLTIGGRTLVESAERIENELTDARRALLALSGEVTGTVTVGGFQSVIQTVLIPTVTSLNEKLPGLEVIVTDVTAADGLRRLREGGLDLLLLEADSPQVRATPKNMHDTTLLEEAWLVALPLAAPTPNTLDDLAHQTWLGVDPTAAAHAATNRVLASFDQPPPIRHVYSNSDVAMSMVAAGLGIALLPTLVAIAAERRREVRVLPLPGLGTRRVAARTRRARRQPGRELQAVLAEISATIAGLRLTADSDTHHAAGRS